MSRFVASTLLLAVIVPPTLAQDWKPASNPIFTRYGKGVDPDHVLPEYPRPQMVRKDWLNLNGLWLVSLQSKVAGQYQYDQHVLVPFPVESALSGVKGRVDPATVVSYRRTIEIPPAWSGKHILLHFGAVDWETTVKVNDKTVGTHRGGYDPFSFDITNALTPSGAQQLEVDVTDPTD